MKFSLLLAALLSVTLYAVDTVQEDDVQVYEPIQTANCESGDCMQDTELGSVDGSLLSESSSNLLISVTGQGVAPMNTTSPAQAYALAKRAATADAYRLIAEKVKGVRIDGQDLIKNMMVQRSTVRTSVNAMVRNASVVETTFKEGLCEVEMEIHLSYADFQ
jgi:hypothetical protein